MAEARKPRAGMFVPSDEDPRNCETTDHGERSVLADYLSFHRRTLELKCSGLSAGQLAQRSAEPSTMSLLGLVRHMADVERHWFREVLAGEDAGWRFRTGDDIDAAFNGAVADDETVSEAFQAWEDEVAHAEAFFAEHPDLDMVVVHERHGELSFREVVVHMVEEYARHNGHADLLQEAVDGQAGE